MISESLNYWLISMENHYSPLVFISVGNLQIQPDIYDALIFFERNEGEIEN
jgi:hypothetical protein